jgi:hypothetical protein
MSDAGVNIAGTGRVGSSPAGYERGSAFLILKREEADEATEDAPSLRPVDDENVEAIDSRDRHEEPDEEVELVAVVFVDARDDMELRRDSSVCENILCIICGGCLASSASMCRIDSSGMST